MARYLNASGIMPAYWEVDYSVIVEVGVMAENLEENLNKLNCIGKIDNSNRAIAFKTF